MRDKRVDNVLNNGFKQNPQNINRKGRPKKTVNALLEEIRKETGKPIKKVDIQELYLALLDRTDEELKAYVNDKSLAMMVRIIAKSMLDKKGFDIIERMLDRSIGRPTHLLGEDKENKFSWVENVKNKIKENE